MEIIKETSWLMNGLMLVGGFIVVSVIWSFFTGKGKTATQQKPVEQIATILNAKLQKGLRDIANGVREPKDLQLLIEQEFQKMKDEITRNYGRQLTVITSARKFHENFIKTNETQVGELKAMAAKHIKAFEKDGKAIDQETANNYLSQIVLRQDQIEKSQLAVDTCVKQKLDLKLKVDTAKFNIATQEGNIYQMIYQPSATFNYNMINVSSLMVEWEQRQTEKEVEAEVNADMNGSITNTDSVVVDESKVNNLWSELSSKA